MSIEALGHVFLLTLPANEKWLLVCLANHADKWGDSIFPALETLEEESGMSRSTVKRAFKELLRLGVVERSATSTPVSPAFYRIVGVPEPRVPPRSEPSCPYALRRAVIHTFEGRCEYCQRLGGKDLGPDDRPWQVDRVVPGRKGGIYTPDNVTLSCQTCNNRKKSKDAPAGTRTLTVRQRERTVQVDPSPPLEGTVQLDPSPTEWGGVQPDLSEGSNSQGGRGPSDPPEGSVGTPNLCIDPIPDPISAGADAPPPENAGAPRRPHTAAEHLRVVIKLAHEVLDLFSGVPDVTAGELAESIKSRCAFYHVPYDSGVVSRALEAALYQRRRVGKPSIAPGSAGETAFRLQQGDTG